MDAAVVVFARDGVERATTNAIAREAKVSPGSLYQYYRDKDDLLAAVGQWYADELSEVYRESAGSTHLDSAPMPAVLDTILDPIVAFKNTHAAFLPLFARPDLPPSVSQPVVSVDALFAETVASILGRRNPAVPENEVRAATVMLINLFRGLVSTLGTATGDPDADLAELKLVMLGYLERKGIG